jgi:hypothetical protein
MTRAVTQASADREAILHIARKMRRLAIGDCKRPSILGPAIEKSLAFAEGLIGFETFMDELNELVIKRRRIETADEYGPIVDPWDGML